VSDAASAAVRRSDIVGRDAQRAGIDVFAATLSDGPSGLLIRGEAGIGKSVLWQYTVDRCRSAGCRVLQSRPAEEEMPLPLVGLADLFEHTAVDRGALRDEDDAFARGRAVLDALRASADDAPTLLAVDDLHWLDSGSAGALRFAIRRLEHEHVGIVVTVRPGPEDPLGLERILPPGRCEAMDIGPLGLEDLRRILAGTLTTISRPLLSRIHEVSGGNPLYAIEVARALAQEQPTDEGAGTLPLPRSLRAAIAHRLASVPVEIMPVLETISATGSTTVGRLRDSLLSWDPDRLLAEAVRLGVVVVEEDLEVRFRHPLLGSVVYGGMTPLARRALHGRLAERAVDADDLARHLALSVDAPDAGVADLLEAAAERARTRGAADLAAEFAQHSVRLTPVGAGDDARRRTLIQVSHLAAAGEASRALALADRLIASLPPGPGRAEVLVQRFYVEDDDLAQGDALLRQAVEEAGEDELLRGRVLDTLGWLRGMFRGLLREGIESAREAVAIAARVDDPALLMQATGHLAHMEWLAGSPQPARMAAAVAMAEKAEGPRLGGGPRAWLAKQLFWAGDTSAARTLFDEALSDDVRLGNELERPYRLYDLALVHCATGNLAGAEDAVREGIQSARDAENTDAEGWMLYPASLVQAWRGQAAEAGETAEGHLGWGRDREGLPWIVRARSVLGMLALSEGRPGEAAAGLAEAVGLFDVMGFAHPGVLPIVPDAVEASAGIGDNVTAEALFRRLEGEAAALGNDRVSALLERSRGILLLAGGEADGAADVLDGATGAFEHMDHWPDAARAVLWRGKALVRAGRRTLAADVLAEARARFSSIGAALWEERSVEELERVAPGRGAGTLTSTERRVAELVAQGLKNREIARTLFVSVATVEAHLTRMYRKLDIRSRSDLVRLVGEGALQA
jgi:DNA-binding CsgD family transcriptional regulator